MRSGICSISMRPHAYRTADARSWRHNWASCVNISIVNLVSICTLRHLSATHIRQSLKVLSFPPVTGRYSMAAWTVIEENAECHRSLLVVAVNPHEHTRTPRTQAKWRNERKRGVASGRRGAKRPRRGLYLRMAKLIAGLLLNKNRPILFLCNETARRWNGPKIYNNVILPLWCIIDIYVYQR